MDKRLLDILVCPLCKSQLHLNSDAHELICKLDRLAYPIRDNVPVMLVEEARSLSADEILWGIEKINLCQRIIPNFL